MRDVDGGTSDDPRSGSTEIHSFPERRAAMAAAATDCVDCRTVEHGLLPGHDRHLWRVMIAIQ